MARNFQLCLATLIVLTSFPRANNQASVLKTETCFHQGAPCSIQNMTCSDDERIVILDELRAFDNGSATCTDRCSSDCCHEGNFQCLHSVSGETFSRIFSNCWNKVSCQYIPLPEVRVFTSSSHCNNGSSLFGVLKYSCMKESAVRDFTDPTPAVGNLLVASFSPSSRVYPACVGPNSTLQCVVEREQAGSGALYIRVMLVMNHSTPGNCSKLHVTAENYKSPDMLCSNFTEFIAVDNINIRAQIFIELQLNNVRDEVWAVVQSSQMLKMTCGKTCSSTTATPQFSSTPPLSSSDSVSQPVSTTTTSTTTTTTTPTTPTTTTTSTSTTTTTTTPTTPTTTTTSTSTTTTTPTTTTTTGLGRTSMETGGGEAITTPVIASLAVLSVLLATALCVAVCVILRQRRRPADATYARTLPVSAEERTYASLHADPRPQVVSLEPLSGVQPGPARGGHPSEPQYEIVM